MARPTKCRRVCRMPKSDLFGPINSMNDNFIIMTIDEYETIRLMDLEKMTQEECADKMNVARSTVQRIYNDARLKIASALVNGDILKIEGGEYTLCKDTEPLCGCKKCHKIKGQVNCSDNETNK